MRLGMGLKRGSDVMEPLIYYSCQLFSRRRRDRPATPARKQSAATGTYTRECLTSRLWCPIRLQMILRSGITSQYSNGP